MGPSLTGGPFKIVCSSPLLFWRLQGCWTHRTSWLSENHPESTSERWSSVPEMFCSFHVYIVMRLRLLSVSAALRRVADWNSPSRRELSPFGEWSPEARASSAANPWFPFNRSLERYSTVQTVAKAVIVPINTTFFEMLLLMFIPKLFHGITIGKQMSRMSPLLTENLPNPKTV